MSKKKPPKGPKTIFDKLHEIAPGYLDTVMTGTESFLKNELVRLELSAHEIKNAKKKDKDLEKLKLLRQDLAEQYVSKIKSNQIKRSAVVTLSESIFANQMDTVKNELVNLEVEDKKTESDMEIDMEYQRAKEQLKIANETYSEPLKLIKLQRRVIVEILEQRGKI